MEKVSKPADLSRLLRQSLGNITQGELAARLLLSRNYISQIEAGLKSPSERVLAQMHSLLTQSSTPGPSVSIKEDKRAEPPQAPYDELALLRQDIRRQLEHLIVAAGTDRDRLGWIAEQLRLHLTVPPRWLGRYSQAILPSQTQALSSETGQPLPDAAISRPARRA